MPQPNNTQPDQDLLARLNALKKSHIKLDEKGHELGQSPDTSLLVDPAPARALNADLLSRFQSLNRASSAADTKIDSRVPDLLQDENSKSVEELLAELGPEELWTVPKDEQTQISDLLKSANVELEASRKLDESLDDDESKHQHQAESHHPSTKNETSTRTFDRSDYDDFANSSRSMQDFEAAIDRDADEHINQVLDELKRNEENKLDQNSKGDTTFSEPQDRASPDDEVRNLASLNLPDTPMKDPDPPPTYEASESTADDDLASRFANLGLPSVPTTLTSPSRVTSKPTHTKPDTGFTDEDIDSWCIICNEDATLRCIGCDGDLYCTSCWLEGHRGEDAGYEERKHKAVQYNKSRGKKKQPARRVAMGA